MDKKNIKVVAAVIKNGNKIYATQRGYGEFKGGWEFPGGKIEQGETNKEALIREIKEELDADINIDKFLTTVDYTYPNFHLLMDCFICSFKNPIFEFSITPLSYEYFIIFNNYCSSYFYFFHT